MEKQDNVVSMEMIKGMKVIKDLLEEWKDDEDWEELLNETDEEREQKIAEFEAEMEEWDRREKEIQERFKKK